MTTIRNTSNSDTVSRYDIWNAWLSNGWTVAETAREMKVTQARVREVLRSYGERGDRRR